jgi:RNA polymerase sigma-70 factor (ECF subfamily)
MAGLRQGRTREDFDEFFCSLLPRVLRVGQRLTGNRQAAEDVAAEAFARAYARWSRVGGLAYRDAWVLRVATNLAIDAARRRLTAPALDREAEVLDFADVIALRTTLVAALAALSRSQREAVVLRYLIDLPEDEVALALGIRPGTVKSHLHRAVTTLRSHIPPDSKDLGYDPKAV